MLNNLNDKVSIALSVILIYFKTNVCMYKKILVKASGQQSTIKASVKDHNDTVLLVKATGKFLKD